MTLNNNASLEEHELLFFKGVFHLLNIFIRITSNTEVNAGVYTTRNIHRGQHLVENWGNDN